MTDEFLLFADMFHADPVGKIKSFPTLIYVYNRSVFIVILISYQREWKRKYRFCHFNICLRTQINKRNPSYMPMIMHSVIGVLLTITVHALHVIKLICSSSLFSSRSAVIIHYKPDFYILPQFHKT